MPDLTIISANVDSQEWAKLLIQSIRKFTKMDYEIVIIDNDSLPKNQEWLKEQKDVRFHHSDDNLQHGGSMDLGTIMASAPFVCFLDIDSHIQREGWEYDLFEFYRSDDKIRMIGTEGPDWHPFIAPLFFYERDFVLKNGIFFRHVSAEKTIDTAQMAYFKILEMGYKVEFVKRGKRVYPPFHLAGDEIYLNGKPTFYHHWNGTRFNEHNPERRKKILDGITIEEHLEGKKKLFQIKEVKEILRYDG